jgi:hypothetical protein
MKSGQWKLGLGLSATLILLLTIFAAVTPAGSAQDSSSRVRFGMDINSIDAQKQAGVPADYATVWAGVWNLKSGWGGPNAAIDRAVAQDVTPVVHFYYWGDDISKNCVENGCYSKLHGAQKDKAGWQRLAQELATNLNAHRNGKTVVIIIESEFNKGDIQTYEAFDGYLVEKEKFFREQIPGVQLVLGFGNWKPDAWKTFDRAASGADFIGIQALRGSTKNSLAVYEGVVDATLSGMNKAKSLFGKPILVTDLGLSSYPEPDYEQHQARALGSFFSRIGELKAAGLRGVIYRSWSDTPMDTANYYGEAERHWGLVRTSEPSAKAAKSVWINGVKTERANSAPAPATSSPAANFDATFAVSPNINEWWVEVAVQGTQAVRSVDARVNGGARQPLTLQEWGHWAKSFNVPRGSQVQFRATSTSGAQDVSQTVCWMCSAASPTATTTSTPPPARPADLRVEAESFSVRPSGKQQSDPTASQGAFWNQTVNGAIEHTIQSGAGNYELRVRAKGERLGGISPQMDVYVDGTRLGSVRPGTSWAEHTFSIALGSGGHTVKIAYSNDYSNTSGDRNLHVDRVDVLYRS